MIMGKKVIKKILNQLKENHDEWLESLVNNLKDPDEIQILNYYQDLHNKKILQDGDNIHIKIDQDGINIDSDAVIVRYVDDDQYLIKLPGILDNSYTHTHCGMKADNKICECYDYNEDIGKCWFVNFSNAYELDLYPNRKGFKYV
jgi:hypothetical protein